MKIVNFKLSNQDIFMVIGKKMSPNQKENGDRNLKGGHIILLSCSEASIKPPFFG